MTAKLNCFRQDARDAQARVGASVTHGIFESRQHLDQTVLTSSNTTSLGPVTLCKQSRGQESFAMSEKSHRLYVKGKHIS